MTYRLDVDSELRFEVEYGAEVQLEVSIFVFFVIIQSMDCCIGQW